MVTSQLPGHGALLYLIYVYIFIVISSEAVRLDFPDLGLREYLEIIICFSILQKAPGHTGLLVCGILPLKLRYFTATLISVNFLR